MTEKKYQKLREIIIKANPDIVKLKFRCRTEYGIITKIKGIELRLNGGTEYISKGQVERGVCKIIGREITLSDVLFIYKKRHHNPKYGFLSDDQDNYNLVKFIDFWNLKNNSLAWHWENQKETCEFLYKLICE